jgi:hypothetical protein
LKNDLFNEYKIFLSSFNIDYSLMEPVEEKETYNIRDGKVSIYIDFEMLFGTIGKER